MTSLRHHLPQLLEEVLDEDEALGLGGALASVRAGSRLRDDEPVAFGMEIIGAGRVVSTLSERDWSGFVQERRTGKTGPTGQPVGDRQVVYDLKFLLSVLNWATKAGDGRGGFLLHENPLKGCPLPKEKSPRRPLLYDEEY